MADFDSSLPVRTESAGDIVVKVADATIPAQQLTVEADGSINVNTTFAPGAEVQITDGTDTLEINADGSINSVVTATDLDIRDLDSAQDSVEVLQDTHDDLNANVNLQVADTDVSNSNPVPVSDAGGSLTVDAVDLDIRDLTHVSDSVKVGDGTDFITVNADGSINITDNGGSLTVDAVDLDIRNLSAAQDNVAVNLRDESGNPFTAANPLPVTSVDSEGTEVNNYNTAAAVASGATSNHDYTVTAATTLKLSQIWTSASGKMKAEVQIETGVATGVFNTRFVAFSSSASPNIDIDIVEHISVAAGVRVRVIRTNTDNQAQDLYSTICGHEIS